MEEEISAVLSDELIVDDGSIADGGSSIMSSLCDPTKIEKGKVKEQRNTCRQHINGYLVYTSHPKKRFEDLTREDITKDFLGKFSDYLFKVANIKSVNTMLSYISSTKQVLLQFLQCDKLLLSDDNETWYNKLRRKLVDKYLDKCQNDGTALTNHAEGVDGSALRFMCEFLFFGKIGESGFRHRHANRWLLTLDRFLVGRIDEAARVKYNSAHYDRKHQMLRLSNVVRGKNRKFTDNLACIHKNDWQICPFHCYGTYLALLSQPPTHECMFSHVPSQGSARYVNDILKGLVEIYLGKDDASRSNVPL
jgi:hypothetical protein